MININAISKAIKSQLEANSDVAGFINVPIVIGEYVNQDPDATPWIGVYKKGSRFDPRTLGSGANNWEATIEHTIIVQAVTYDSGDAVTEDLEEYVQKVLTAILSDKTMGNTVDFIVNFDVEYSYIETDRESIYFQQAMINLTTEVKTS